MYNETLHDKSGSFLASVSANILQLSDWHINIIRMAFDDSPASSLDSSLTSLKIFHLAMLIAYWIRFSPKQ